LIIYSFNHRTMKKIIKLGILLVLIILSASYPATAKPGVEIISLFSDENSMEITLQSHSSIENGQIEFKLTHKGDIIDTKTAVFNMTQDSEITKVIIWDIHPQSYTYSYVAIASIYINDELIDEASYPFSYGFATLPRFQVVDLSATSSSASLLLKPRKSTNPAVADLTIELIQNGDIIYAETKDDVSIIQAIPLSINWPILLEDHTDYIVRVKALSHSPQIISSYVTEFTSCQDIEIDDTDVEVDDFGISVTLYGRSQVPFDGTVEVELKQAGADPLIFSSSPEILTLNRDDTVGIIWNDLNPGTYNVFILVKALDGKVLDRYETVLSIPEPIGPVNQPAEQKTPGFGIILTVYGIIITAAFIKKN
jgi:hypothetical protein